MDSSNNKAVLQLISELDSKLEMLKALLGGSSDDASMESDELPVSEGDTSSSSDMGGASPKGGLAALFMAKAKSKKGV